MSKKIFMIAGEASGDLLGGRLMGAMQKKSPDLIFHGVGGDTMERHGLKSIFPMEDLSVMGIAEVLPKISLLYARIVETADHIMREQPDVVVTIDAPDFCFAEIRVAGPRRVAEQRRLAPHLLLDEDAAHAQRAAGADVLQRVLEHDRGVWRGADGVEHRPKRRGFGFTGWHDVFHSKNKLVAEELAQAERVEAAPRVLARRITKDHELVAQLP